MIKLSLILFFVVLFTNLDHLDASQHEDVRYPNVLFDELANTSTKTDARKLYIDNVPPQHCNCDWMVLPKLEQDYRNKSKELCPRCECKYESRNLTIIKWAITFTVCAIACLTVYMVFLIAVEYLNANGSRRSYDEQINEEVSMDDQSSDAAANRQRSIGSLDDVAILPPSKNVINRVNQQQSKWKKQIIEQRKNIYDRHTMLN